MTEELNNGNRLKKDRDVIVKRTNMIKHQLRRRYENSPAHHNTPLNTVNVQLFS